jgi:hypothetical protein
VKKLLCVVTAALFGCFHHALQQLRAFFADTQVSRGVRIDYLVNA